MKFGYKRFNIFGTSHLLFKTVHNSKLDVVETNHSRQEILVLFMHRRHKPRSNVTSLERSNF
jgi:hypothetical protein